mgnify:CR=1 FL=1
MVITLSSPRAVTCVIMQNTGAGIHTEHAGWCDTVNDGPSTESLYGCVCRWMTWCGAVVGLANTRIMYREMAHGQSQQGPEYNVLHCHSLRSWILACRVFFVDSIRNNCMAHFTDNSAGWRLHVGSSVGLGCHH